MFESREIVLMVSQDLSGISPFSSHLTQRARVCTCASCEAPAIRVFARSHSLSKPDGGITFSLYANATAASLICI